MASFRSYPSRRASRRLICGRTSGMRGSMPFARLASREVTTVADPGSGSSAMACTGQSGSARTTASRPPRCVPSHRPWRKPQRWSSGRGGAVGRLSRARGGIRTRLPDVATSRRTRRPPSHLTPRLGDEALGAQWFSSSRDHGWICSPGDRRLRWFRVSDQAVSGRRSMGRSVVAGSTGVTDPRPPASVRAS